MTAVRIEESERDWPQAYVEAGFALVSVPLGEKAPNAKGWNRRQSCITSVDGTNALLGKNIGLAHAYSDPPTMAFDIDNYQAAVPWFENHGINLDALLVADDAVQIRSGKPNRAKLLYRLPNGTKPPASIKIAGDDGGTLFELRCATANGRTVQDVLPPSIHPDTGKPYEWHGDFRKIPEIPPVLLKLWDSLRKDSPGHAASRNLGGIKHSSHIATVFTRQSQFMTPPLAQVVTFDGKRIELDRYLNRPDIGLALAKHMDLHVEGLETDGRTGSFRCVLPGHGDCSPSASLFLTDGGEVMYRDWHMTSGAEWYTLPEVCASIAYGKAVKLGRPEHATWRIRLLVKAGILQPYPVALNPLPEGAPGTVKKCHSGFRFLLGCKWRYKPNAPTPFSRKFAAAWCGISESSAQTAIHELQNTYKIIRIVDQHGFLRLWLPT